MKIKILLAVLGLSCLYVPPVFADPLNLTNNSNDVSYPIILSASNGNAGDNSIVATTGKNTITASSGSYAVHTFTDSSQRTNPVNLTIEGKTGNEIISERGSGVVAGYYDVEGSTSNFGYGGTLKVIADTGDNVIQGNGDQGYGVAAINSIDANSGVTIESVTGNNKITGSADAAAAANGILIIKADQSSNYLEGNRSDNLTVDSEGHALHVSNPNNTFNSTDRGVGYSLIEVDAGTSNTFIGNYDMAIVANGENATANISAGTTNTVKLEGNAQRTAGGTGISLGSDNVWADYATDTAETAAIFAANGGTVNLSGQEGNTITGGDMGIWALTQNQKDVDEDVAATVTVTSEEGTNTVSGSIYGILSDRSFDGEIDSSHVQMITGLFESEEVIYNGETHTEYHLGNAVKPAPSVTLEGINNKITGTNGAGVRADDGANVSIIAGQDNTISGPIGIQSEDRSSVSVTGQRNNTISGSNVGLYAKSQITYCNFSSGGASSHGYWTHYIDPSSISITSNGGTNLVEGTNIGIHVTRTLNSTGRYSRNSDYDYNNKQYNYYLVFREGNSPGSTVLLDGVNNEVSGKIGIKAENDATVTLKATRENKVSGSDAAIVALTGSKTTVSGGSADIVGDLLAAHGYTYIQHGLGSLPEETRQYLSTIDIGYGADSTVNGDMRAYKAGSITVAPAEGEMGSIAITGNAYAYGSDSDLPASIDTSDIGLVIPDEIYYGNEINTDTPATGTVDITLSNGSTWSGTADTGLMAYQDGDITEDKIGTVNLELNDTSIWTMTDSSAITDLSGNGGTVYYHDGGDALQVDTVTGSHTWALDLNYDDHSQSDMIYVVNGTSDTQTLVVKNLSELNSQMDDGDAVRFATVKNSGGGFKEGTSYYLTDGLYNDTLTIDNRTISEDPDADENYNGGNKPSQETVASLYGGDDATNIYLVKTVDAEENAGAVTPDKSRDIVWRYVTDLDTFTNRTGQSQYFTPGADQGGWVRLRYRNLGVDGVGEVDGNTYELGYTAVTRQNDERKDRFSASVSYGKETGSWEGYGGDLEIRDFTVSLFDTHEYYPSAEEMAKKPAWKQGTHSYWDNYFKYHHVKTEYGAVDHHTGLKYDGDYSQNVYSLSTEYGRINKLDEKWSIVPQAQLQLSYLGGYDYVDSQDIHVDGDHDWSLIGRLGFDLVDYLDKKQDNKIYFKASLLHEFFDGNDVTVSALGDSLRHEGDLSGTWGVIGLGYSSRIGEKQYFYLDAERYIGNDFDRTYNIRAGVNWKF
ncbi:MAG: autotransporter outer membrane beta-barrel domain-containing protein [Acidaminococcus sp.]|nr:autotransporter outer membrane beta-barrel domain-containing protein [Acidaminococcus sp.]MCI2115117.1 autotransporter outer membrane beta-barrel domain-containing protein [Acidaminococcus sp.]